MDEKREQEEEREEDCQPLTDAEFRAFQEEEMRREKKVKGIFSVIWDAISFFT